MPERRTSRSNRSLAREESVGRAIEAISRALSVTPVDLRSVLQVIVGEARKVAGARYAALGIVVDPRRSFEPWVFSGLSLEEAAAIGRYPRPVGLLGAVPNEGRTIRVRDVARDPRFRGWPPHHPEMTSFMGVPIRYRDRSVGNLYLTDKIGAEEFSADDQWSVELLASYAGVALQVAEIDRLRGTVEEERARLRTILESAPNGILYVEPNTEQVSANAAAVKLLGAPPDPGRGLFQFIGRLRYPDGRDVEVDRLPIRRALDGDTIRAEEYLVIRADGDIVPVLVSAGPVRGADGAIIGAVVAFEDITPIKELERLREEWASLIAHDLRQPVTVINSYVELLRRLMGKEEGAGPESRALEHMAAAAVTLNRMIGELLDVSRLEARRMTLERRSVDLPDLLGEIVERAGAITAGHRVELRVKGQVPKVWADPGRIEQVMDNLLSNAAKYSFADSPIEVDVEGRDDWVQVSVTNRGKGIPREELPLVFSRFHRTSLARAEGIPGLGLGLYISKGLVESHGGRMWVESTPNETTTFFFTLPTEEPIG